jgi:hypothetical protein
MKILTRSGRFYAQKLLTCYKGLVMICDLAAVLCVDMAPITCAVAALQSTSP